MSGHVHIAGTATHVDDVAWQRCSRCGEVLAKADDPGGDWWDVGREVLISATRPRHFGYRELAKAGDDFRDCGQEQRKVEADGPNREMLLFGA